MGKGGSLILEGVCACLRVVGSRGEGVFVEHSVIVVVQGVII